MSDQRMLLSLFQEAVGEQCEFALAAASSINPALQQLGAKSGNGVDWDAHKQAQHQLWFMMHALLNAAANLSKHLWPNEGRRTREAFPDRGEQLRRSLDVPDDSPLANRTLRNHFEHLDERLEHWWLTDEQHNIARRTIGPLEGSIEGLSAEQKFEWFDPQKLILAFRGDLFEIQPLVNAIVTLKEKTDAVNAHPWWQTD
jgi:hypothetical protein